MPARDPWFDGQLTQFGQESSGIEQVEAGEWGEGGIFQNSMLGSAFTTFTTCLVQNNVTHAALKMPKLDLTIGGVPSCWLHRYLMQQLPHFRPGQTNIQASERLFLAIFHE